MNLPVMEDLRTVLAPLLVAMPILPTGNDSGFPSAGQRATCQRDGPKQPHAVRRARGLPATPSRRPFRRAGLSQAGARACLTKSRALCGMYP